MGPREAVPQSQHALPGVPESPLLAGLRAPVMAQASCQVGAGCREDPVCYWCVQPPTRDGCPCQPCAGAGTAAVNRQARRTTSKMTSGGGRQGGGGRGHFIPGGSRGLSKEVTLGMRLRYQRRAAVGGAGAVSGRHRRQQVQRPCGGGAWGAGESRRVDAGRGELLSALRWPQLSQAPPHFVGHLTSRKSSDLLLTSTAGGG